MVRVKITGEVTEVSREIMRLLRAEEKRIRRDRISKSSYSDVQYRSVLYLDDMPEEDDVKDTWLADKSDFTDDIMVAFLKEEFISTLTTRQKEVFDECIITGVTLSDYAKTHGVSVARVSKIIADIQKKAKNFFA